MEWHETGSDSDLGCLLRELAVTAERIVLLSGTTIYKPSLLQSISEGEPANVVVASDAQPVGMYAMSATAARQFANDCRSHTAEELGRWMSAYSCVAIAPAPAEAWQSIRTPEDVAAAEHKIDTWLMKPTDGIFARMNRRISIPISRQLIKCPVSPNVVTLLILGVSVASGAFFARGGYWNMLLGAFLSVWSSILDGCDGEVARFKLLSSELGCWLDTVCDYLYYLIVFVGITWGLKRTSGDAYLVWGVALVIGTLLSSTVVGWMRRRVAANHPEKFLAQFHQEASRRQRHPAQIATHLPTNAIDATS